MFNALWLPFGVSQTCHAVVAGGKHQIFEPVALIDKDMVNTHCFKIGHIVGTAFNLFGQVFDFDFKVFFSLFYPAQHACRHLFPLC
jgi:hypothetical protein